MKWLENAYIRERTPPNGFFLREPIKSFLNIKKGRPGTAPFNCLCWLASPDFERITKRDHQITGLAVTIGNGVFLKRAESIGPANIDEIIVPFMREL